MQGKQKFLGPAGAFQDYRLDNGSLKKIKGGPLDFFLGGIIPLK
jgi:hypothetical protein